MILDTSTEWAATQEGARDRVSEWARERMREAHILLAY